MDGDREGDGISDVGYWEAGYQNTARHIERTMRGGGKNARDCDT
jgi:hypothetical protein